MSGNNSPLFDCQSTRALDQESIEDHAISPIQLMGQAALASLYVLAADGVLKSDFTVDQLSPHIYLLLGKGNNGGDGLALAYHLLSANFDWRNKIHLYMVDEPVSEASLHFKSLLTTAGMEILPLISFLSVRPSPADLMIDAMLGTGQKGEVRSPYKDILQHIGALRSEPGKYPRLLALDLPTGLVEEAEVFFFPPGSRPTDAKFSAPDWIHCYGVDRLSVRLNRSLDSYTGRSGVRILPMGFHPVSIKNNVHGAYLSGIELKKNLFLKDPSDQKYTAGFGWIVAGSRGMEGALMMAASAFFASGGGILKANGGEEEERLKLLNENPSLMLQNLDTLPRFSPHPSAIAIGMGMTLEDLNRIQEWFVTYLETVVADNNPLPFLIIDSGALELIHHPRFPEELRRNTLLTPHLGEWKRLGGPSPFSAESCSRALEFTAANLRCHVIIKDSVSVILSPPCGESFYQLTGGRITVVDGATRSLATAGSGDCLAGVLLALFARKRNRTTGKLNEIHELASTAVRLLQKAASLRVHPHAGMFPELIRDILSDHSYSNL